MTSYNYPLFYPGGLECLYLIKTQKGRVITLEILDFDLENGSLERVRVLSLFSAHRFSCNDALI